MNQFLFFSGNRGCCCSRIFIAIRIEMGTGSIAALIISGPIILLGLNTAGLTILGRDFSLIGSRMLLVLLCLDSFPLSFLLCPRD